MDNTPLAQSTAVDRKAAYLAIARDYIQKEKLRKLVHDKMVKMRIRALNRELAETRLIAKQIKEELERVTIVSNEESISVVGCAPRLSYHQEHVMNTLLELKNDSAEYSLIPDVCHIICDYMSSIQPQCHSKGHTCVYCKCPMITGKKKYRNHKFINGQLIHRSRRISHYICNSCILMHYSDDGFGYIKSLVTCPCGKIQYIPHQLFT